MLARGFSATSVDDVCKDAGLTKGGLFHYFASKEALGAAVLDLYLERVFLMLREVRASHDDPLARVHATLEFLSDASETYPLKQGCILGRFTQELAATHPAIRARCGTYFGRWIDLLERDLEEADRARGLGRRDLRSLAEYAIATFEGALILAKASSDPSVVRRSLDHARAYIGALFEAPAGKRPRNRRRK